MSKQWRPRKPDLSMLGFPVWFHHHAIKMNVVALDQERKRLEIAASAAFLKISRITIEKKAWKLEWQVRQSRSERTDGVVLFTDEQLSIAFGLTSGEVPSHSRWLIDRYGGDYAFQGNFIRWQHCLNIPCPGTGHDGDPNISIEIDEKMQEAVAVLLS